MKIATIVNEMSNAKQQPQDLDACISRNSSFMPRITHPDLLDANQSDLLARKKLTLDESTFVQPSPLRGKKSPLFSQSTP